MLSGAKADCDIPVTVSHRPALPVDVLEALEEAVFS